jgi:serine/threonine protein kinase
MWESGQILQERYQLQHRLGRTIASRQTWLAKDLSVQPHELVIVKLLVFTPQFQWEDLKLFEREAQVLQNLNHSQIPHYRDYFVVEQQAGSQLLWWGLVQDYIPGKTLQELLEAGKRFSGQEIRTIAKQILQILIYLHELSPPVLHRDIKPSNLILGEDKQIYLVDFGAVQDRAAITGVTFTVVGSYGYAPLEQFWGRAVPASDLYALGATLIHLLTGVAPAELQDNLRIQFRDRTNLNPSFASWLEILTEPACEQRFATARQALQELEHGALQIFAPRYTRSRRSQTNRVVVKRFAGKLEIYKINQLQHTPINIDNLFITAIFITISAGFSIMGSNFLPLFIIIYLSFICFITQANFTDRGERFVYFERAIDRFKICEKYLFRCKEESGAISQIQYITTYPVEKSFYASSSCVLTKTVWRLMIRANKIYLLDWDLTEEECLGLVREMQNWIDPAGLR